MTARPDTSKVITIFEFKINHKRNALLCVLKGQFDRQEAEAYVEKFKKACDEMKPNFVIISDLREWVPAKDEAMAILQEGTRYSIEKGSGQAFRIVDESVGSQVGNLQMNKTARQLGYDVIVVHSYDEVARIMKW